ncbi:hypothetical protein XM38_044340 [Halomicronema hongdechloris C2206]|uniref:Uncharacterized protein n=1 Tax=Halomicronema hongdechloris C2206 TaxID=1641165 RepID=A0A1Z3HTL4_9CYAN|nr:hypothetical protein XM38_044340 [Halomicronema hongdechloris C2206]
MPLSAEAIDERASAHIEAQRNPQRGRPHLIHRVRCDWVKLLD